MQDDILIKKKTGDTLPCSRCGTVLNVAETAGPAGEELIERAEEEFDEAEAEKLQRKMMRNEFTLQDFLEQAGVDTRVQTAITMGQVAEPYIPRRAMRHLEKGRVVIFGAGTGNPYFTTDTAAALRGLEIDADVILKGTRVDGVFTADPEEDESAERFLQIHGQEVIQRNLRVMDMTALTLCQESEMPIIVFNMAAKGNLSRLLTGETVGTRVHWDEAKQSAERVPA